MVSPEIPSGLPRNLEAALQRYGSSTYKASAITVLDPSGKPSLNLSYGKLLGRAQKIAFCLLCKVGQKGEAIIRQGDRVALVYPNNDPISFICAFYGCIMAGVVPVPVEVPLSKRVGVTHYSLNKDGSTVGVTTTRNTMLCHCRTLTVAANYTEGEVMVCVLDFKRDVGLWHGILCSVFNGMHVIFVPYSLMKVDPASWMKMVTKYKASVGVVKSRDMHWGLLAQKDHKDINFSSLRLLLIADGANPWSLTSCDSFLSAFQSKGLRPEAICPCASSSEAFTVSIRRPGKTSSSATGRGILSMQGLSYGVVRVDSENSLTSLTLQDCGQVMQAGAMMVVIKLDGPPYLCKTDEVGELCVCAGYTGTSYWGLQGITIATFQVQPLMADGRALGDKLYVRTGLIGFLGPGGLVFVCGSKEGLMQVSNRRHNTDDIIATVLAVEPMKFIYRGRIAVFSIRVLRDERICIIAEQRPDCTEEETPLGGIHLHETKKKFMDGSLHPANVLMCPHTCVTNLPKPREHQFLTEILRWRAQTTPDHVLFTMLNARNVGSTLPTVRMIVEVSKSVAILTTATIIKLLRSKEAAAIVDPKHWVQLLDTDEVPKRRLAAIYRAPTPEMMCYLDFSVSTTGMLAGVKAKGLNLACVRACVVVAEERPRIQLTTSFTKLFASLGLAPRAVSTSFGCRVNVGICLQGASCPEPSTVYVDMQALRNDRVTLVEKGSPNSLCLMESGKIWVNSPHNASGYFTIYGDESLHHDHFESFLTMGDTHTPYARTGFLGFIRRTELTQSDGERHDAIFVVGSLDETVMLRGMRYHPIDVETSVQRCHKKICECAMFTWTNLLVVVVELDGQENEALDLVPLVTNVVLEEHYLIVGVVVVVDPGVIPINSRGEKQRMHLRDGFLADQLDPIYVAYNM
nr:hypothetical protein BaRGS_027496 [Batillaria attramentaria]